MPDNVTFFTFSEEIEQLLDASRIDIAAELRRTGVPVERDTVPQSGSRDAALILLASSVTVASTGWAIAKVLDAVTRGRRAMLRTVDKSTLISPAADGPLLSPAEAFHDQSRITASLDWNTGLKFELVSGEGARDA